MRISDSHNTATVPENEFLDCYCVHLHPVHLSAKKALLSCWHLRLFMPWKVITLSMWRKEEGNLGQFKGRGPSAWAAVNVAHWAGTNLEQSSAWLIGAKQPLLSNCLCIKEFENLWSRTKGLQRPFGELSRKTDLDSRACALLCQCLHREGFGFRIQNRSCSGERGTSHLEGHLYVSWPQLGGAHLGLGTSGADQLLVTLLPKLSLRKCLLSTDDSHYTCLFKASLALHSQLCGLAKSRKADIWRQPLRSCSDHGAKITLRGPGLSSQALRRPGLGRNSGVRKAKFSSALYLPCADTICLSL